MECLIQPFCASLTLTLRMSLLFLIHTLGVTAGECAALYEATKDGLQRQLVKSSNVLTHEFPNLIDVAMAKQHLTV
jgi:hypothetical protein